MQNNSTSCARRSPRRRALGEDHVVSLYCSPPPLYPYGELSTGRAVLKQQSEETGSTRPELQDINIEEEGGGDTGAKPSERGARGDRKSTTTTPSPDPPAEQETQVFELCN
ncbi:unnamed protein product [Gadus morhua 'NCC']